MGMRAGTQVESLRGQCERRNKEARDLVPGVLQLATALPRKRFDREHARTCFESRWPLSLGGIHELQEQTSVAMRKRASVACRAGRYQERILVPGVRWESETDARRISFFGNLQRREMLVGPLRQQRDCAQMAVCACHRWHARPGKVKQGAWCPRCTNETRRSPWKSPVNDTGDRTSPEC